MYGQVSSDVEIKVPADKAWEVYSTLELAKLVEQKLPIVDKIQVVQGDGEAGTILNIIFVPGTPGLSSYKEKYTTVDNDNRIKEAEVIEGGYLDLGFTLYRVRFQILDTESGNSIIRSTIEYELKDELADPASQLVSIKPLEDIASLAESYCRSQDTTA